MSADAHFPDQNAIYQLQAELCQALADPTRLQILDLLGPGPMAVKDLVQATGQRQAKISQHLAVMRQRDIVTATRVGPKVHYTLTDPRILDACRVTLEVLMTRLIRHGSLAAKVSG